MAEGISLPPGAFAAAKSGAPQPAPVSPKADAPAAPETRLRKAPDPKAPEPKKPEPKKAAPQLSNRDAERQDGGDEPEMTAKERKIWKLKDGDDEFEFDATDEEAVKREIQKSRAANKKFDSAAAMKREAENAFQMLRDPAKLKEILQDPRVGVDLKKFAEDYVWEQIQQQQREAEWAQHPEKKVQWEKEQRLAAFEANEARAKEEGLTRQQKEAQARYESSYEQKFIKAIEKNTNIPRTPEALNRMAELTMMAVEHNIDLTEDEIASVFLQELDSRDEARLRNASPEQLARMVGEEGLKRLREWDLGRLKNPQGNPFPTRSSAKTAASGKAPPAQARKAGTEWKSDLVKDFLNRKR